MNVILLITKKILSYLNIYYSELNYNIYIMNIIQPLNLVVWKSIEWPGLF